MEDITGQFLDEHVGDAVTSVVENDVTAQVDAIVAGIQAKQQARRDDIVKTASSLLGATLRNKHTGQMVGVLDFEVVDDRRHSKRQGRPLLTVELITVRPDGVTLRIGITSIDQSGSTNGKWKVIERA